ncbi:hypothetical protein C8Q73DRAFT_761074 [Cubamyces lactineus]|nr:hypothetical protein C8Q73DRAFT_761074 [Cubamyces lactineus]
MRTRPGLKSCLKITPPITPDLSAASSPCGSGRTSPSLTSDGGSSASSIGRKTVAFCPEDDLEEVFWADEWDRTPAAVTPKLSYQDILELKQLRISLPYSPPPPPPRQPFTTSLPSAGPSTKPPFPVSRFATGPSHTPSKWKNRSEPRQSEVDPEILPYLDAVPIRLLPLLPQSPPEPTPADVPEPHPQTPTPTASPEHRPAPPPPSEPPEIKIEPPAPAPLSSPPPKKHNFAFVPLLPVQDQPQVSPPPITVPSAPARPKRTFNMTFLPVNAAPEPTSLAPAYATPAAPTTDASMGTPSSTLLPSSSFSVIDSDPKPNDADRLAPPSPTSPSSSYTPIASTTQPPAVMSPPPMSLPLPASSRYAHALESDNETEADTTDTCVSDTDAESDAPSTSTFGSSLPSPPLEDDDDDVEARLEQLKLGTSEHDQETYVRMQDPGSYFPPVPLSDTTTAPITIPIHPEVVDGPPALPSGPGQTPPLSVLYPSPTSQHQPLLPLDAISSATAVASAPSIPSSHPLPPSTSSSDDANIDVPPIPILPSLPLSVATGTNEDAPPATPLSMSNALKKKLMLEALPSPALVPPSPFELEPLGSIDASPTPAPADSSSHDRLTVAEIKAGVLSGAADRLSEKLAALSVAANESRAAFMGADTPNDSPLLTLESMRDAWDASARVGLGVGVEVGERLSMGALSPSLSRRRSS